MVCKVIKVMLVAIYENQQNCFESRFNISNSINIIATYDFKYNFHTWSCNKLLF